MPLFPDEFPFKKAALPQAPAPAPAQASAMESQEQDEAPLPVVTAVPQAAVGKDRRRSPRQNLVARALLRCDVGRMPGFKVDLLNISMLGIRFRSDSSMSPGDKASVKLECGPLRWSTKLRVVHCVPMDDQHYAIGCEFIANELVRPIARAA